MQAAGGPGHGGREGKAQGVRFLVAADAPGAKDALGVETPAERVPAATAGATAAVAAAGAPTASVEAAATASVADEGAQDDAASAASSRSVFGGDSVHTDPDQEDAGDLAAVAAGGGAPTRRQSRRERPARDTTPVAKNSGASSLPGASCRQELWGHAGNVGFLFGNWGRMPCNVDQRRNVELALKRGPAMIVGLAECEAQTEALLNARGEPKPPAVAGVDAPPGLEGRESFEYLTLRGSEECSVLIGLRATMGNQLTLVWWDRRFEGTYRKNKKDVDAYTRVLVAKVSLDHSVAFIGHEHNVMVVHLHHHLANNKWPQRLHNFWPWLVDKLQKHDVKVLMGDFNMALFRVIPELRSRGVVIDLAAWYPWKALEDGEAMADSCGIFFLNAPGEYKLHRALGDLHDRDDRGILSDVRDAGHVHDRRPRASRHPTDWIPKQAGPGQPLDVFLPKAADLREKIEPSLQESQESSQMLAEAQAAVAARRRDAPTCPHLRVKEKRLDAKLWTLRGANVKGSHFPICAFTNNVGRRAPEALAKRQQKRTKPRNEQAYSRPIIHGGGVTSTLQPTDREGGFAWRQEGHQTQPQWRPEGQPQWQQRAVPDVDPLVTPDVVNYLQDALRKARPGADDSRSGGSKGDSWSWRDSGSGPSWDDSSGSAWGDSHWRWATAGSSSWGSDNRNSRWAEDCSGGRWVNDTAVAVWRGA